MKIQLLHNADCDSWKVVLGILKDVLVEQNLKLEPEILTVENDVEAAQQHFFGSPQILIDGKDVDTMAKKFSNYHASGCRMYIWQEKVYEYPPKEMILQALENI